jgi:hypothetical protein
MPFLIWLQATPLARWVGGADTIWAYPTILALHTAGLGIVVGTNLVVALRLLGVAPHMSLAALRSLYRPMWAGFALNAVTGALLFAAGAEFTGVKPIFYFKLLLIAAALVVTVRIRRIMTAALASPGSAGSRPRPLAVVSLVLWTAAIFAGRYTAYF